MHVNGRELTPCYPGCAQKHLRLVMGSTSAHGHGAVAAGDKKMPRLRRWQIEVSVEWAAGMASYNS